MKEIFDFIHSSKVATVCCVKELMPHCFNCFYVFMDEYPAIVFKSSDKSEHVKIMQKHTTVAGTIYACSANNIDNVGVQFKGQVLLNKLVNNRAGMCNYKRFPMAAMLSGSLYVVLLNDIKYTKTSKGIRTRSSWSKQK